MKKETSNLSVYSEITMPEIASLGQMFHRPLKNHYFGIQTVTSIVILKHWDVLLFEYVKTHKWQVRLTDDRTFVLRPNVASKDVLSVMPCFVQINQNCIINLAHLALIENKTQKCIFDVPYLGTTNVEISPLYYKKIKDNLNIL
jgi:hypothetical protein